MNIHGFKKQKGQAQKPQIAPDDLVSTSVAKIMYGLAEGEIYGLADGGKSIRLDGTPLINDNGQPNFTGVNWNFRTGTLDQSHISGFPAVENETNVGVELRHDRPWVKAITNRELSAVRVRLNFNALREQKDNGDITGYAISYAIDVQTDGGSFQEVLVDAVRGKSSQGYKKSHRIDLPKGSKWTIRVRRITPNQDNDLISDTVHIDALTEIIDAKLAYPCTALLGLSYDAKTFANIAKLAVRLKGKIIQVPTNYNPQTRTYHGLWDGSFKLAYSNNPAWVFYDLCTHKRYGLGERLAGMVDKWRLYQIGQYCDELVDDGQGKKEPRFTCNVYIQKADDAYRVLQNLASVFRGLSFWDGSNIVVDADTPKEPVYTFSPANVVGGEFAYTGTRARDRHTLAKVAWDNPDNGFNTEYELIPDEQAIAKYGVRVLDISAFGCTSKGQAQRAGLWALKAEQLETQTVSFKTGLMGFIPQVGQVINIADNVFAGRAVSGKIMAVSVTKRQITLDRTAGKVGDTLTVNGTDGVQTAKISAVHGQVLTIDKPINAEPEHIWAVISDDLKLKQFRILTITQNDDATFDITALQYEYQKYDVIDHGAIVKQQPYTVLKASPITAPTSVHITAHTRTHQGQAITTMTINWEQVQGAVAYIVKWRKDDGNWQTLPKVSGQSVDIDGVYAGNYMAQVQAVDAFDNESLATYSAMTPIKGKIGKPPRLASLTVKGVLFGMNLAWVFARGSDDTNFTEIQVSPDGRSNITTLGTFAYPTNKHEITGLQGGLTQFYRGRIVDKLGNTSDWTDWAEGTTDDQAEKVLELIQGQINESHLHQTLSTPIAKIGGLETAVNAVNAQLPTLNNKIATLNTKTATLQTELNTAKNTLQTATANIATERNRITSAIRDIGALQTANNAKTQEIANLTNTVGSHTSSIRELGVTTGDLSQKYTALKTATDTATSEITAVKQTQNGQATSIERLGAKFDNLRIGGRNLILNSKQALTVPAGGASNRENQQIRMNVANIDWTTVKQLTLSVDVKHAGDLVRAGSRWWRIALELAVPHTDGTTSYPKAMITAPTVTAFNGRISYVWNITKEIRTVNYAVIFVQNINSNGEIIIANPKLEIGNIATDWTPAPEDSNVDLSPYATNANLETLRQTLTNTDTALSQQITAMDTAYKSTDRTLTANLQSETTARTNADTALTQRIDSLQTDYNGNKASVANQLKTLSNKDTATASQISSLTANVTTAQNTANTASGKADTATTKADNAQRTANDAVSRANTANSAITAEQKARADADSSLASQITALDTAYKSADSRLSGRITTAQNTATNAQNAVASVQSELTAKFDSLAVGGRNYAEDGNFNRGLWFATKHANSDATFSKENGVLSINGTNTNWKQWQIQSKEGTRANVANASSALALLQDGETYTLSVEARSDSDTGGLINLKIADDRVSGSAPARIDVIAKNNIALTTEWKRYLVTGVVRKSPEHNIWRIILEAHTATQPVYFRNVKLEKGSIPTDWTPAPEDLQVNIDSKATTASLNEFKQTSANADKALGERITAIDTAYKQADTATNAKLANAEKAISDNNTALSQRITALDTAYKKSDTDITARLAREETARTNGDNANAQALRTLESTVNGVSGRVGTSESKIATLERTTANTNQALATAQSQLNARFDGLAVGGRNLILKSDVSYSGYHSGSRPAMTVSNDVAGAETLTLSADIEIEGNPNTTYAISNRAGVSTRIVYTDGSTQWFEIWQSATNYKGRMVRTFNVPNGKTLANINVCNIQTRLQATKVIVSRPKLEIGNIATDWTPAPEDLQVDLSPYATNSSLNEFKQTQATKDTATAQKLSQLESGLGTKANASALNDLSTKVGQVDGKITAEAQKVSILQTTVQGQTASIQQHAQSLNGLSAQWTLKVQSGNIVSGIGLASNDGVSDFAVRADKFYIAPPTGTGKGSTPFAVLTTSQTINGVQVPAGTYIKSAYIQNGSITTAKLADASIDNAKIKNGVIDSAKIANGAITTAKIGTAQIDTLQIKGEAVVVPRLQYSPQDFEFYTIDTEEEINRVTIDAKGGAVSLQFTFEKLTARSGGNNDGSNGAVIFRIKRGSTTLRTIRFEGGMVSHTTTSGYGDRQTTRTNYYKQLNYEFITLATLIDTPPSGNQVYTVTLESRGLNSGKSKADKATYPVVIKARSFHLLGVRR